MTPARMSEGSCNTDDVNIAKYVCKIFFRDIIEEESHYGSS